MDLDQRDVRRAAAKEFLDALDQLQESLQTLDGQPAVPKSSSVTKVTNIASQHRPTRPVPPTPRPSTAPPTASPDSRGKATKSGGSRFTLRDLEMAIADIDNYMQTQHSPSATSSEEG